MDTFMERSSSLQKMATDNALVELKAGLDFNILNAISLAQTGILQPYLSEDLDLRRVYAPDANSRIVNMTNTYFYVGIGIVSPEGIVLDHTIPELKGADLHNEPFFQEAMQGKVSIGAPYRYQKMVVYAVASPVYSLKDGKIIGVVYNISKLTDTMSERMLLGDKGYLFVADKYGTVFIHKNTEQVFAYKLYDYDWGLEILSKGTGILTFTENGQQKIAYYDHLENADWTAVAVRDLEELAAPGKSILKNAMIIALIILVVLATIIYFYVKNIVDALLVAVNYAEQISKGVLDKDVNFNNSKQIITQRLVHASKQKCASLFGNKKELVHTEQLPETNTLVRSDEIGVLYKSLRTMVNSMQTMVKKADDASRMKSEFLANMSHEIRTPLNAIIGLAHLYLENKDSEEEKKRDYVKKIEVAGKSLLGIINNVLDTSKIEAGMFDLENVHLNLQEIGEQILTVYQSSASSKNLTLTVTMEKNLNFDYMGDPIRLGQVLNNLVGNSIKFTEKGSINVHFSHTAPEIKDIPVPEGTMPICIKVQDTGIGISKESQELLFKPFAQADTSITRRFGGTGLGLAISKNIIEIMQGSLLVESTLGEGTKFTILLFLPPSKDAESKLNLGIEENGSLNVDLTAKRILVVEDNMINQLIMEELLQKTNADVFLADNGQIAVDMIAKESYDIVFMDMQMPVMDGIEATRIIRSTLNAEALPIIAITANAMKEDKEKGIAMGLNDYLTKPIDPRNLMLVLHYWLCEKKGAADNT